MSNLSASSPAEAAGRRRGRKRGNLTAEDGCHSEGAKQPKNLGGDGGHDKILRCAQNDRYANEIASGLMPLAMTEKEMPLAMTEKEMPLAMTEKEMPLAMTEKEEPIAMTNEHSTGGDFDLLPEEVDWRDGGCEVFPACLNCPLPRCIEEEPRGKQRLKIVLRARQIRALRRKGMSIKEIARFFGISQRTVQRALKNQKSKRKRQNDRL